MSLTKNQTEQLLEAAQDVAVGDMLEGTLWTLMELAMIETPLDEIMAVLPADVASQMTAYMSSLDLHPKKPPLRIDWTIPGYVVVEVERYLARVGRTPNQARALPPDGSDVD